MHIHIRIEMQMEKVLRFLYLRRVYLWPRYHVVVKEYLSRHEPEVRVSVCV